MSKNTRSKDAIRRRNALIYQRSLELERKHQPFTLSKKELWMALCDEFYISHPYTVGNIIAIVQLSVNNGTYQEEFGCYV
jgi:hypothetical protein